jgi:hypothetical protein
MLHPADKFEDDDLPQCPGAHSSRLCGHVPRNRLGGRGNSPRDAWDPFAGRAGVAKVGCDLDQEL